MGNTIGEVPRFSSGQRYPTAADLNVLADLLAKRILGGVGIDVVAANGNLIINRKPEPRPYLLERVIAKITSDEGGGKYLWTLDEGAGPLNGEAYEISGAEGVEVDTVVVLFLDEGRWKFSPGGSGASSTYGVAVHKRPGGTPQTIAPGNPAKVVRFSSAQGDQKLYDVGGWQNMDAPGDESGYFIHPPHIPEGRLWAGGGLVWVSDATNFRWLRVMQYRGPSAPSAVTEFAQCEQQMPATVGGPTRHANGRYFRSAPGDIFLLDAWQGTVGDLTLIGDRGTFFVLEYMGPT